MINVLRKGRKMRTLGRIILLGVGIALLVINIPAIIQQVNSVDWSTFDQLAEKAAIIGNLISRGVSCFIALIALVCALIGKATFTLGLIAIIEIGLVIWAVVAGFQNGTITWDWKSILDTILAFILPILYFLGTLFISLGRK